MIAPDILLDIAAIASVIIGGIFAIIGALDRVSKGRKNELDSTETRLIDALKLQVETLEKKVEEQWTMIEETKKRVEALTQENTTMRKILQGRDVETVESVRRTKEILELSKENSKNIERLYQLIEKYLANNKK